MIILEYVIVMLAVVTAAYAVFNRFRRIFFGERCGGKECGCSVAPKPAKATRTEK